MAEVGGISWYQAHAGFQRDYAAMQFPYYTLRGCEYNSSGYKLLFLRKFHLMIRIYIIYLNEYNSDQQN